MCFALSSTTNLCNHTKSIYWSVKLYSFLSDLVTVTLTTVTLTTVTLITVTQITVTLITVTVAVTNLMTCCSCSAAVAVGRQVTIIPQ